MGGGGYSVLSVKVRQGAVIAANRPGASVFAMRPHYDMSYPAATPGV